MTTVGFLSHMLHSSGGLELCELAVARGLAANGWDIRDVYLTSGDLEPAWAEFAQLVAVAPSASLDEVATGLFAGVDVIHIHADAHYGVAARAGRALGIPVVAHLHLPPPEERSGWRRVLRGRHREPRDPDVFGPGSGITRFVAVSTAMRRAWIAADLPPDRVDVVHNGIDLDRFRPPVGDERASMRRALGIDPAATVIGYVGRIDDRKGVPQLVDAFARIAADRPDVVLVAVGEPTRHLLEADGGAAFAALKATSHPAIRWLGKRTDVAELYRAMDLLVVPSQWEEPFGMVATEAMASGLCVVATARGGLPEILDGELRANLVGPTAPEIATRLGELVDRPERRAHFGLLGREAVERRFSLAAMVGGVEESLRAALAEHSVPASHPPLSTESS